MCFLTTLQCATCTQTKGTLTSLAVAEPNTTTQCEVNNAVWQQCQTHKKWLQRNISEEDLRARLLSSCHSRVSVNGLQTEWPWAAGRQQLYAALQVFSADAQTHTDRNSAGWLTDGDDHSQNSHCQVLAQEEMLASSWRERWNGRGVRARDGKDSGVREDESEKPYGIKKKCVRNRVRDKTGEAGRESQWKWREIKQKGGRCVIMHARLWVFYKESQIVEKSGWNKKWKMERKMMSCLAFARVWPWHCLWPPTLHPCRLHQAHPHTPLHTTHLTTHLFMYSHTIHACPCRHKIAYSPRGAQFIEGKATFSRRRRTIHHSRYSHWSTVVRACRCLALMSSLRFGRGY